jgi:hypothetical protein
MAYSTGTLALRRAKDLKHLTSKDCDGKDLMTKWNNVASYAVADGS